MSVCPQHLLIAHTAHFLVCCRVNIRVRRKDVIADVLLDSLFQKQLADAVPEHTEDGFERFSKDFRQEVACIFTLQIAAIELNCFVNEVILCRAAVQLVVVLHLQVYVYVLHSLQKSGFFLQQSGHMRVLSVQIPALHLPYFL